MLDDVMHRHVLRGPTELFNQQNIIPSQEGLNKWANLCCSQGHVHHAVRLPSVTQLALHYAHQPIVFIQLTGLKPLLFMIENLTHSSAKSILPHDVKQDNQPAWPGRKL